MSKSIIEKIGGSRRKWLTLQVGLAAALMTVIIFAPAASAGLNTGNGTWSWVHPSVQGNVINALSFIDDSTGYAAGTGGLVMKTTDGGDNWTVKTPAFRCPDIDSGSPGSGCTLNAMHFVDASNGWVVGDYGTIKRTTNGGDSWTTQSLPGSYVYSSLYGLSFASSSAGIAVGNNYAFYTTNGGSTWTKGNIGSGATGTATVSGGAVTGVTITNGGSGYASATVAFTGGGGTNATGTVTVSGGVVTGVTITNGGSGYTSAPTVTFGGNTGPGQWLQAVQMTSTTVGYAVGSTGSIFKTTDGGATWLPQTSNTTATLRGLYFTDSSNGFAVGQSDTSEQGFILRTTDGGANWSVNSSTTINNRLRGIAVTDAGNTLVITSEDGVVLRRNSASNWTDGIDTVAAGLGSVSSGTTSDLSPVRFAPSSTTGFIGGAAGMILKTTDSGASLAIKAGGDDQTLRSTSFINSTTGWIAGTGGTVKKTIDGGATWSNDNSGLPSDVEIHAIHFLSTTEGFAVGCRSTGCRQDGVGTSVSGTATVSGGAVTGVDITYSSGGWATAPTVSFSGGGGSGAAGTATVSGGEVTGVTITDGGSGYTSAPTVTFSGGGSTGVAYKYSSGTWTQMSISGSVGSLNGLKMANATNGLAVGSAGTALRTTNGTSWTPVSTGISSSLTLFSVDTMNPASNGWAAGELEVSEGYHKGAIVKFNGSSWSQWDMGNSSGLRWLTSVDMVNSTIGYAVGNNTGTNPNYNNVYKTTDGGATWSVLAATGTSKILSNVAFMDRNVGFAVGDEGRTIRTTDGGATWSIESLGTNLPMFGVTAVANSTPGVTAYAVGMGAGALKSENAIATPPQPYHTWYDYGGANTGLYLFDAARGYAPTQAWYSGAGNWDGSRTMTTMADKIDDNLSELYSFYNYGGSTTGLFLFDPAAGYPSSQYQPQSKWTSCAGCWNFSLAKTVTAADQLGKDVTEVIMMYNYGNENTGMFTFNTDNGTDTRVYLSGPRNWDWSRTKVLTAANYDGDATTEIAVLYDYGNANTGIFLFDPDEWGGEGYVPTRVFLSGPGNLEFPRSKVTAADQDGNGKGEIVLLYDYGNANTGLFVFNPDSTNPWFSERKWLSGAGNWDWNRSSLLTSADQDGDGKTENAILYNYGSATSGLFLSDPASTPTAYAPAQVWYSGSGGFDWSKTRPI